MCICFSSAPLGEEEQVNQRYTPFRMSGNPMYTPMHKAPCSDCPTSCFWFLGQFLPVTSGCTQYFLRRKTINYDMTKYKCFQGQFTVCCCIKGGSCYEESCPTCCLCLEAHCCNGPAVSASRALVMDQYNLIADPCDNQLARFSNCMQYLTCICYTLAMFDDSFRDLAQIIDFIAEIVYHTVSGCMTSQVAAEINYQITQGNTPGAGIVTGTHGIDTNNGGQPQYVDQYATKGQGHMQGGNGYPPVATAEAYPVPGNYDQQQINKDPYAMDR